MDKKFRAEEFLETVLPALAVELHTRAASIDAVVQIGLLGPGEHHWTLDFTLVPARVRSGASEDAELILLLHPDRIVPLVTGELDVHAAWEAGTVEVHGDVTILARLAEVLRANRALSALDLRLGRAGL